MTNKMFEKLKAAKEAFDKAAEEYQKLSKEIEEALADKPRMVFNKNVSYELAYTNEITRYFKYSDYYIEFDCYGHTYRYIRYGDSNKWKFPRAKKLDASYTAIFTGRDVFQRYSYVSRTWEDVDYIERIELLEGVTEYDKNRKL